MLYNFGIFLSGFNSVPYNNDFRFSHEEKIYLELLRNTKFKESV